MAKKILSCVLAGVMLSQAALSSAAEGNFWSERRAAARRMNAANSDDDNAGSPATSGLLAQLPQPGQWDFTPPPAASAGGGLTVSAVAQTAEMESSFPGLPSGLAAAVLPYGTIREAHLPRNPASPLVVHIQDAHGIEEAQRNISAMIAGLSKIYPLPLGEGGRRPGDGKLLVCLEGAEGPFVTPALRQAGSADVVKDVADYFLKEGRITGAEYAALTAEVPPFLWGVEKWEDYQADVQSVKDAHPLTPKTEAVLKDLGAQADKLKEKIYSAELKELDRRLAAYRAGGKLGDHVRYLMQSHSLSSRERVPEGGVRARSFPNLALLLDALDAEDALDFKLVERERRQLVELLATKCPKSVLDDLVQKSIAYRSGRWTGGRYHAYLKDLCRSRDIRLGKDFPRMWAYINYVILSDGINRDKLLDEISAREQTVEAALARTPEQKRLAAAARRLGLLDSLIQHKMTPNDWAEYEKSRNGILVLPKELDELAGNPVTNPAAGASLSAPLLKPFEDFCGLALKRNEALADNLLAKIAKDFPSPLGRGCPEGAGEGMPLAVLVAGGFHTEDLVRRFTEKGAGIVVVTPKITEVPKDSNYMDVFVREPLPLEKMFRGEPISLVEKLASGATAGALFTNLWVCILKVLKVMKGDTANVVRELNETLDEAANLAGPGWPEAHAESAVRNRDGSGTIIFNPLPKGVNTPLVEFTGREGEGPAIPTTSREGRTAFSIGGNTFVSSVKLRPLPVRVWAAARRWISARFSRSAPEALPVASLAPVAQETSTPTPIQKARAALGRFWAPIRAWRPANVLNVFSTSFKIVSVVSLLLLHTVIGAGGLDVAGVHYSLMQTYAVAMVIPLVSSILCLLLDTIELRYWFVRRKELPLHMNIMNIKLHLMSWGMLVMTLSQAPFIHWVGITLTLAYLTGELLFYRLGTKASAKANVPRATLPGLVPAAEPIPLIASPSTTSQVRRAPEVELPLAATMMWLKSIFLRHETSFYAAQALNELDPAFVRNSDRYYALNKAWKLENVAVLGLGLLAAVVALVFFRVDLKIALKIFQYSSWSVFFLGHVGDLFSRRNRRGLLPRLLLAGVFSAAMTLPFLFTDPSLPMLAGGIFLANIGSFPLHKVTNLITVGLSGPQRRSIPTPSEEARSRRIGAFGAERWESLRTIPGFNADSLLEGISNEAEVDRLFRFIGSLDQEILRQTLESRPQEFVAWFHRAAASPVFLRTLKDNLSYVMPFERLGNYLIVIKPEESSIALSGIRGVIAYILQWTRRSSKAVHDWLTFFPSYSGADPGLFRSDLEDLRRLQTEFLDLVPQETSSAQYFMAVWKTSRKDLAEANERLTDDRLAATEELLTAVRDHLSPRFYLALYAELVKKPNEPVAPIPGAPQGLRDNVAYLCANHRSFVERLTPGDFLTLVTLPPDQCSLAVDRLALLGMRSGFFHDTILSLIGLENDVVHRAADNLAILGVHELISGMHDIDSLASLSTDDARRLAGFFAENPDIIPAYWWHAFNDGVELSGLQRAAVNLRAVGLPIAVARANDIKSLASLTEEETVHLWTAASQAATNKQMELWSCLLDMARQAALLPEPDRAAELKYEVLGITPEDISRWADHNDLELEQIPHIQRTFGAEGLGPQGILLLVKMIRQRDVSAVVAFSVLSAPRHGQAPTEFWTFLKSSKPRYAAKAAAAILMAEWGHIAQVPQLRPSLQQVREAFSEYNAETIGEKALLNRVEGALETAQRTLLADLAGMPIPERMLQDKALMERLLVLVGLHYSVAGNIVDLEDTEKGRLQQNIRNALKVFVETNREKVEGQPWSTAELETWIMEGISKNREERDQLIADGYDPSIWTDGIKLTGVASSRLSAEQGALYRQRHAQQIVEIAKGMGLATEDDVAAMPLHNVREARQYVEAVIVAQKDRAIQNLRKGGAPDPEDLFETNESALEDILREFERLEAAQSETTAEKTLPVSIVIRKDFLEEAGAGLGVPGCFNPRTGVHREMPVMHGLEANAFFANAYDADGRLIANVVLALTDKGVVVFGDYNSTAFDLHPLWAQAWVELAKRSPGVILAPGSAGRKDLPDAWGKTLDAPVVERRPSLFKDPYFDFGAVQPDGRVKFSLPTAFSVTRETLRSAGAETVCQAVRSGWDRERERLSATPIARERGGEALALKAVSAALAADPALKRFLPLIGRIKKFGKPLSQVTEEDVQAWTPGTEDVLGPQAQRVLEIIAGALAAPSPAPAALVPVEEEGAVAVALGRATTPEAEHWGEILWLSLFASAVGIVATHYLGIRFGALGSSLAIGASVFSLFFFPGFRRFLGGLTSVFGVAGAVEYLRLRGPPEGREARLEVWALSHLDEKDHRKKVTKDENPGSQYMRLIAAGRMFLAQQEATELKGRSWAGLAIGVLGLATLEGILRWVAPHAPAWVQVAGLIVFGVVGIMQVFPKARGFIVHVGVHSLYNAIYYLMPSRQGRLRRGMENLLVRLGLPPRHRPVRATGSETTQAAATRTGEEISHELTLDNLLSKSTAMSPDRSVADQVCDLVEAAVSNHRMNEAETAFVLFLNSNRSLGLPLESLARMEVLARFLDTKDPAVRRRVSKTLDRRTRAEIIRLVFRGAGLPQTEATTQRLLDEFNFSYRNILNSLEGLGYLRGERERMAEILVSKKLEFESLMERAAFEAHETTKSPYAERRLQDVVRAQLKASGNLEKWFQNPDLPSRLALMQGPIERYAERMGALWGDPATLKDRLRLALIEVHFQDRYDLEVVPAMKDGKDNLTGVKGRPIPPDNRFDPSEAGELVRHMINIADALDQYPYSFTASNKEIRRLVLTKGARPHRDAESNDTPSFVLLGLSEDVNNYLNALNHEWGHGVGGNLMGVPFTYSLEGLAAWADRQTTDETLGGFVSDEQRKMSGPPVGLDSTEDPESNLMYRVVNRVFEKKRGDYERLVQELAEEMSGMDFGSLAHAVRVDRSYPGADSLNADVNPEAVDVIRPWTDGTSRYDRYGLVQDFLREARKSPLLMEKLRKLKHPDQFFGAVHIFMEKAMRDRMGPMARIGFTQDEWNYIFRVPKEDRLPDAGISPKRWSADEFMAEMSRLFMTSNGSLRVHEKDIYGLFKLIYGSHRQTSEEVRTNMVQDVLAETLHNEEAWVESAPINPDRLARGQILTLDGEGLFRSNHFLTAINWSGQTHIMEYRADAETRIIRGYPRFSDEAPSSARPRLFTRQEAEFRSPFSGFPRRAMTAGSPASGPSAFTRPTPGALGFWRRVTGNLTLIGIFEGLLTAGLFMGVAGLLMAFGVAPQAPPDMVFNAASLLALAFSSKVLIFYSIFSVAFYGLAVYLHRRFGVLLPGTNKPFMNKTAAGLASRTASVSLAGIPFLALGLMTWSISPVFGAVAVTVGIAVAALSHAWLNARAVSSPSAPAENVGEGRQALPVIDGVSFNQEGVNNLEGLTGRDQDFLRRILEGSRADQKRLAREEPDKVSLPRDEPGGGWLNSLLSAIWPEGRTLYLTLDEPIRVGGKTVTVLRLKGIRPVLGWFGRVFAYASGNGVAIREVVTVDQKGSIFLHAEKETPGPRGTMTLGAAQNEFNMAKQLAAAGVPVDVPLAVGQYTKNKFKNNDIGFVIAGMEGKDYRLNSNGLNRPTQALNAVVRTDQPVIGGGNSILLFESLGRNLRAMHKRGLIHHYVHQANIGLVERETGEWEIVLRDLDNVTQEAENLSDEEIAGNRFVDVFRPLYDLLKGTYYNDESATADARVKAYLKGYFSELDPKSQVFEELNKESHVVARAAVIEGVDVHPGERGRIKLSGPKPADGEFPELMAQLLAAVKEDRGATPSAPPSAGENGSVLDLFERKELAWYKKTDVVSDQGLLNTAWPGRPDLKEVPGGPKALLMAARQLVADHDARVLSSGITKPGVTGPLAIFIALILPVVLVSLGLWVSYAFVSAGVVRAGTVKTPRSRAEQEEDSNTLLETTFLGRVATRWFADSKVRVQVRSTGEMTGFSRVVETKREGDGWIVILNRGWFIQPGNRAVPFLRLFMFLVVLMNSGGHREGIFRFVRPFLKPFDFLYAVFCVPAAFRSGRDPNREGLDLYLGGGSIPPEVRGKIRRIILRRIEDIYETGEILFPSPDRSQVAPKLTFEEAGVSHSYPGVGFHRGYPYGNPNTRKVWNQSHAVLLGTMDSGETEIGVVVGTGESVDADKETLSLTTGGLVGCAGFSMRYKKADGTPGLTLGHFEDHHPQGAYELMRKEMAEKVRQGATDFQVVVSVDPASQTGSSSVEEESGLARYIPSETGREYFPDAFYQFPKTKEALLERLSGDLGGRRDINVRLSEAPLRSLDDLTPSMREKVLKTNDKRKFPFLRSMYNTAEGVVIVYPTKANGVGRCPPAEFYPWKAETMAPSRHTGIVLTRDSTRDYLLKRAAYAPFADAIREGRMADVPPDVVKAWYADVSWTEEFGRNMSGEKGLKGFWDLLRNVMMGRLPMALGPLLIAVTMAAQHILGLELVSYHSLAYVLAAWGVVNSALFASGHWGNQAEANRTRAQKIGRLFGRTGLAILLNIAATAPGALLVGFGAMMNLNFADLLVLGASGFVVGMLLAVAAHAAWDRSPWGRRLPLLMGAAELTAPFPGLSRYEGAVGNLIGAGGQSHLWELLFGKRDAVIKVSKAGNIAFEEALKREYECLKWLRGETRNMSPADARRFPRVYAEGVSAENVSGEVKPIIAMERIHGKDLSQIVGEGTMSIGRAFWTAAEVLRALDILHRGYLHRDVRPENVMVSDELDPTTGKPRVVLLDFGLALNILNNKKKIKIDEGAYNLPWYPAAGTPEYFAPETGRTPHQYSPSADVYSLGVTLFFMLTGRCSPRSYTDAATWRLAKQIFPELEAEKLLEEAEYLDLPPKLQAILVKALAPNPEDRYATAEEMLKDIESVGDLSAFKEKAEGTNRAYFRQAPWNEKWKVLRTIISADAERTFLRDHLGEDEAGLKKNPSYPALMRALRNLQAIIVAGFLLGFFLAVAAALHFVHPSDEIQRLWLTLVVSGAGLGIGGLSALAADVKAHSFLNRRAYRRVMEQLTKLAVSPKDEGRRRLLLDSMRVGRRVKAPDRQWLEDHGIHWDMLTAETPPKRELPIEDQLEKQTTALETNPGDRDAAAAIPGLLLNLMGPLVRVSESQAKPQNLETYQRILSMTAERNIDQLALSYFLLRDTNTRRGFLDVLTEGKDHPVLATLLWAHEHPFAEWGKAKAPAAGLDRNTLETLAAFHVLDAQLSEDLPSGGVRAINVTALLKSANAPASVREAVQALAALADARVALGWETRGQTVLTANAPADDPEALALGSRFNNLRMVTGVSDSSGRKIGHELLVKNVKTFKPDLASLELLTPNPAADVDATAADLPGVHFVASALRLSDLVQRALRALAVALASA